LDAIEKYFENLYTSASSAAQEQCDSFIQELRLPKLSDEERDELEGVLTYDECKQILGGRLLVRFIELATNKFT